MNIKYQPKHKNRAMALFLAFSLVLINLISSVPVYADVSPGFLSIPVYVPTNGSALEADNMQHVYDITGTYPTYAYCSCASDQAPAYLALVQRGNAASGTYDLYGFSKDSGSVVWRWREYHAAGSPPITYPTNSISLTTHTSDIYYSQVVSFSGTLSSWIWDSALPIYSSLQDAISAFSTWTPVPVLTSYFSLDPGNVAYISLSSSFSGYDFTLRTTRKSTPFDLTSGLSSQSYSFDSNLPTTATEFITTGNLSLNVIRWQLDGFGLKDIFGNGSHYIYNISGTASSSQNYLVLYNPLYVTPSDPDSKYVNNTIIVDGLKPGQLAYVYPITQVLDKDQYGSFEFKGTISQNDIDDPMIGIGSEDGSVVIPSNSSGVIQNFGGYNEVPEEETVLSTLESVKQTLTNFVDRLVELISAPASHIQQLIQAGSAFMQSFSSLYTWLPPEVSSTVISALIVVVVIGVFKVLL